MIYELLLSIAGFIIVTSLTIIGYLFKNSSKKNEQLLNGLIEVTANLKETNIELRTIVQHMRENDAEKHHTIDKRLDAHAGTLKSHTTQIAVINAKLKKS